LFIIKLGKNVDTSGTYVTIKSTKRFTRRNGHMPFIIVNTGLFNVEEATNISNPNGGVIIPIPMLSVTIRPKCIGSIPREMATGNNGGTRIRRAEFGSINIPAKKKEMFTANKNVIIPASILNK
jgi:hypothetical protein